MRMILKYFKIIIIVIAIIASIYIATKFGVEQIEFYLVIIILLIFFAFAIELIRKKSDLSKNKKKETLIFKLKSEYEIEKLKKCIEHELNTKISLIFIQLINSDQIKIFDYNYRSLKKSSNLQKLITSFTLKKEIEKLEQNNPIVISKKEAFIDSNKNVKLNYEENKIIYKISSTSNKVPQKKQPLLLNFYQNIPT